MTIRGGTAENVPDPFSSHGARPDVITLRLSWGLLSYFGIVTLLITLTPFRFHWPSRFHFLWIGGWFDTVCNVLLFLPLGFLYRLARRTRPDFPLAQVLRRGLIMSAAIEITQLFLRGRYASPTDVLTNGLGALLGAWLCDRGKRLLNERRMGRLALELPLMNIVYLLVPLIWLNGLAAGDSFGRSYLSWLLGLCGSLVLAGVYRYGMKQTGIGSGLALSVVAGAWFFVSSIPVLLVSASIPLYGCFAVALAVCVSLSLPDRGAPEQRRFEIPILKQVFPIYIAYLLLILFWPIPTHYAVWRGSLELQEIADSPGAIPILRLVESFAAFTLLGYMAAELMGRREASQKLSLVWSCSWCSLAAAILEVSRGFHPAHVASLSQGLLALIGSIYGTAIYWMQLASIRRLLGRHS